MFLTGLRFSSVVLQHNGNKKNIEVLFRKIGNKEVILIFRLNFPVRATRISKTCYFRPKLILCFKQEMSSVISSAILRTT